MASGEVGGVITTERLELVPMTPASIDALVAEDSAALVALGLSCPEPLRPPPETGDVLHMFREMVSVETSFSPCFIVRQMDRMVLGSGGVMPPDGDGVCIGGYGIYPEFEGQGYATEAWQGLVRHALTQDGVRRVRATIHPTNIGSRRVAEKAGMVIVGSIVDPQEGLLDVWEIGQP